MFFFYSGSDGQQQCLLVTSEVAETMETNAEEPQQQQQQQQQTTEASMPDIGDSVTEPLSIKTDAESNDQVVAQVVRAEPPSPGKFFSIRHSYQYNIKFAYHPYKLHLPETSVFTCNLKKRTIQLTKVK